MTAATLEVVAAFPCTLEPGPTRAVAAVLDGETVRLDDGTELRFLDVLAPRAEDAGADSAEAWPPADDARMRLAAMVQGQSVALAFAGQRSDRHGRVRAHVFLKRDPEDVWVQAALVDRGLVRVARLASADRCLMALLEREKAARTSQLGLWGHAAYQIRPADRPEELARFRHTFQIVRGRVERVRTTRALTILELTSGSAAPRVTDGQQWGALRLTLKRGAGLPLGITSVDQLAGRNLVARGWIEVVPTRGPEIALPTSDLLQLED